MSATVPAISAIVLAGGDARRLGGAKAGRRLAGRSLLARALDLARAVSDDVLLLARDRPLPADVSDADGLRRLDDQPGVEGPLAGLVAGLHAARHPWALLLPCDMPFVTPAVVDLLRAAAAGSAAPVVALPGRRGPEPFAGLWRTSLAPVLGARADAGERSLVALLEELGWQTVDHDALRVVDPDLACLDNVNTPAALAAAAGRVTREVPA